MKVIHTMILTLIFALIFITGCKMNQELELVDDLSEYHSWYVNYFNSTMDEDGNIKFLNISIVNSEKNRFKQIWLYTDTDKYKIRENENFKKEDVIVGEKTLLLRKVLEMHGICNDYIQKHANFKKYDIRSITTDPAQHSFNSNEHIYKITQDKKIEEYHSDEFNGYVIIAYTEDEIYHFCFEKQAKNRPGLPFR